MRMKALWKTLAVVIGLLDVAVPAARAQTAVATGTITQKVTVDLSGAAGSAKGTIDPFGTVSATTGGSTATFTVVSGEPILVGGSFQAQFPLTDDCSVTGTIVGGAGAFSNSSGSLSLTGSPCLLTPDVSSFHITGSGSISLNFSVDESCRVLVRVARAVLA